MNPTLKRFNHPAGLVRELEHWVVLNRLLGTAAAVPGAMARLRHASPLG
jgi:hypothetical protein